MQLPLENTRVIELGQNASAPFCGSILADLGAQVTKVEKPTGDDARRWGPPFLQGTGGLFFALNRNKQSIAVDLRDPTQRDALRERIVCDADVCIQNLRPGRAGELGLGAQQLVSAAPRLVYCNIGAFGNAGPLASRPAFDAMAQAMSGLMSVTGEVDGPPLRTGTSICDMGTAMWAAIGIIGLLLRREATGRGGIVDASLFETGLGWMSYHVTNTLIAGNGPGRYGSGHALVVPNAGYPTRDGQVLIAANNDRLFRSLCDAIGAVALADDPRFSSNEARVDNREALDAELSPRLSARTTAEWIEALEAAGVPCAPVLGVADAAAHPQTKALDMLGGDPAVVRIPLSIDGQRPAVRNSAPPAPDSDGY